jgi:broad specificity phosphatase PhoE
VPAVIYLARHGRTEYNHVQRFQGQLPVPLDEVGRAQAARLAERAAAMEWRALWSSPLARARETADAVAARIDLEPREDARLMETDAGDWTDRMFVAVEASDPDRLRAFLRGAPDFGFPGGESFVEHGDRVMAALAEIERGPQPALVVCHGVVMRLALSRRAGEPGPGDLRIPNAALVPLDGGLAMVREGKLDAAA